MSVALFNARDRIDGQILLNGGKGLDAMTARQALDTVVVWAEMRGRSARSQALRARDGNQAGFAPGTVPNF